MNGRHTETFRLWHEFIEQPDSAILDRILADEVKFHSPFVWKPKTGKASASAILLMVTKVFQDFQYVRKIIEDSNWVLEFEATVGEFSLRGVDLIELDMNGKIVDFEVMIRPANALQALGEEMGRRLAARSE